MMPAFSFRGSDSELEGSSSSLNVTADTDTEAACRPMEPVRYTKQELLSWQETGEDERQWQSIAAAMPPELLDGVAETTARRRCRSADRRQRPRHEQIPSEMITSASTAPLFVQSRMCLDEVMCTLVEEHVNHPYEEEDLSASSEDEVSLQPLAFMVEGEPDFDIGPPQDGFEYLRRVMWEAAQCPKVKVANIGEKIYRTEQTCYMPEIAPIPSCSQHLLPSKEWIQAFLKDFLALRAAICGTCVSEDSLEVLPPIRNKSLWLSLCFGKSKGRLSDVSSDEQDNDNNSQSLKGPLSSLDTKSPYLRLILRLDENSRATLFRYHVMWLNEQRQLAYNRAMWLFALAASVDSPLDDQTSAAFRDMLRKCAELRSLKTTGDDELYMLNILITIAGEFFGQAEDSCIISA